MVSPLTKHPTSDPPPPSPRQPPYPPILPDPPYYHPLAPGLYRPNPTTTMKPVLPYDIMIEINSSSIRRVAIYWAMVFCRQRKCVSTSSSPTNDIYASRGGYYHHPNMYRFGFIPSIHWDTLWWNPLMVLPIMGFITQVSDPNRGVARTTAL